MDAAWMDAVMLRGLTEIYCICRYEVADPRGTRTEMQV